MTQEQKAMIDAHIKEVTFNNAEFTNFGWAEAENFISSKTTDVILHTSIQKGKIEHRWDD